MRKGLSIAGIAAAVAASVAALLLAGCGGPKTDADPFVGTWRQLDSSTPSFQGLIIAKVGSDYRVMPLASFGQASTEYTRQGNKLTCLMRVANETIRCEAVYVPESGHLTFVNSTGGKVTTPVEFERVSTSTNLPAIPQ